MVWSTWRGHLRWLRCHGQVVAEPVGRVAVAAAGRSRYAAAGVVGNRFIVLSRQTPETSVGAGEHVKILPRVWLWSYIARDVDVLRSLTSGSLSAQLPASASSEPPAAPPAMSTHLMFQPVCVPAPEKHRRHPRMGDALLIVRDDPPYIASV